MPIYTFLFLWFLIPLMLPAKVLLAVSPHSAEYFLREKLSYASIRSSVYETEEDLLDAYKNGESKLAIVRSDLLYPFYKESQNHPEWAYHIIGKLKGYSSLYFAVKKNLDIHTIDDLRDRRVSIGKLGNYGNIYLKKILGTYKMRYAVHLLTSDAYRSLESLRKGTIDILFLFSTERYQKILKPYLRPYPAKMKSLLSKTPGILCKGAFCYAEYYLIASDNIGKKVMHNIYAQIQPSLSSKKILTTGIGKYYVDIGFPKPVLKTITPIGSTQQSAHTNKIAKTPKFHRTPWMDLAIAEAIRGKGSAENVLPMLDLSYKYIRFAKGSSGITTAPNDNKEGSWCAAYICWTLDKSGYKIHSSGRMASQSFRYFKNKLYRKIDSPIFGAITVYTNMKNKAHGHVGYLFGKTKSGRYIILGGNQSNRLKFSAYPIRFGSYRLNGFYVPVGYTIKKNDYLDSQDIYSSAQTLNHKYGITGGRANHKVR